MGIETRTFFIPVHYQPVAGAVREIADAARG